LKAHAAIDNYNTSALNYSNAQKSYQYAEQRFNLGTVNQLQLNMAKSNLDNAISKLTQAKYEYLFNTKLLDFYQGKKIEL
ncbi:MAG TPA: TolC family protein, partial [Chitinophagales bacterium]|nr:TolC family protein [Chitinophagales bacterium]